MLGDPAVQGGLHGHRTTDALQLLKELLVVGGGVLGGILAALSLPDPQMRPLGVEPFIDAPAAAGGFDAEQLGKPFLGLFAVPGSAADLAQGCGALLAGEAFAQLV